MTEVLTSAQMRAIERAAIDSGTVTGLDLMERAGQGVVEAVMAEWPALATGGHRAVVLCGPGNNGGDGFVVARLLAKRGWEVEAFLYGEATRLPPDARANYALWAQMHSVVPLDRVAATLRGPAPDLICDALFGTGLTRPLQDDLNTLLDEIDAAWPEGVAHRVAIDLPSGLCADSGRFLTKDPPGKVYFADRPAWHQDLTVTFHRPKRGHHLAEGPDWCGRLVVCDIGLSEVRSASTRGALVELSPPVRVDLVKGGNNWRGAHKYSYGHALILSGASGHCGAARLAARGALRIGAGLVTVGCPPEALAENAARLDAIMLREIADGPALAKALEDQRINALCLGPGMGTGPREAALLAAALRSPAPGRSIVLDADALTILARNPDLFAALHQHCVLTPHAGEFARLFPDIAAKLAEPATKGPACSKVDATREAAARAGCVVLFKGPDTVIADPSGRCAINAAVYDRAAPWLATAGSGDVLAGFITGLLARDLDPFEAARTAAWLHVECARSFGPGLIAEDLPEQLPVVFRALGL